MSRLAPEFARLLGDGSGILSEAVVTNCEQVEPVHFLAYLAKTGGAILRTEFLEARQVNPDRFCENLYELALDEERSPGALVGFGAEALSESSRHLWETFEQEMARRKLERGTEALFLLALFQRLDAVVRRMLVAVARSEEEFERFCSALERRALGRAEAVAVFEKESPGKVIESAFDKSGKRALNLLREETAALGYKKATAMHLLYALVGIENGVMQRAIQFQAIDPMKEVHGYLSRELTRAGAKRVKDFELSRETLHDSVARILEAAAGEAQRQGVPVNELLMARALVSGRSGVVLDYLTSRKVSLDVLREYLARAESEVEETSENLRLPIKEIEAALQDNILGQGHAIRQILPWIKRLRFGFPRERGAAAVLLFLGPSGTGKTQLAKELARTVYGAEDEMLMLEMGQFNSKESINLFIGAPPGYVGYGEGKLTNGLRDKPQCVVLFDEVEKAHEEVWVALLRFLDEGLISDPAGPTRDGRRCIIVLTSNLGADTLAQRLPSKADDMRQMDPELEKAIRDTVLPYLKRPEIYNRVDDKVVFRPFDRNTYRKLVDRQVQIETRKFADLGTEVQVMDDVFDFLTELSIEKKLEGARCVPRIVNTFVVSPVIDLLTDNEERRIRKVVISKTADGTLAEEA